ncbi:MAG: hypothetical protein C0599_16275 [Salinivirgaceae bacterium]|nr:MAG: hypothetical protein C0599_16275 [Salinivirgaceae bacterium]
MKISEQKEFLLKLLKTQDISKLNEFIDSGGNVNVKLNNAKQTILDLAVSEDKYDLVKQLIENGADVNVQNHSGSTPIFSVKSINVAELLIKSGADLKATNKKGYSILYYLISSQEKELTAYLSEQMGEKWNIDELRKVEPMDEEQYWKIVEKNYRSARGDESIQASSIVRELMFNNPTVIISFQKRTYQLANLAHTSNLWAAAYVINGGCSDDSFKDFKHWVISLGKSAFYRCVKTPDNLIPYIEKKAYYNNYSNVDCPGIAYVARMAYEYRTGLDNFYEVLDYSNVTDLRIDFELDWDENSIETKRTVFPMLWEKYWV